ncbi:MAG: hypothetical protein WA359_06255 [Acidimicrobiales bacterium]
MVAVALSNVSFANAAGATTTTIFGQTMTPGTSSTLSLDITLDAPGPVAFDSNGDLFIANIYGNTITVVPASTGTIFGQSATAGVAAPLAAATGLDEPTGIAFDANGDLFISNGEANTITVVPASTGTIFGQSVTAGVAAPLAAATGLDEPTGIAFDANGDLFVADIGSNTISVVPAISGALFGQTMSANVAATLSAATGLDSPFGIAVDASGDLFIANTLGNSVSVLPASTGIIFGQSFTANVVATLSPVSPTLDGPSGFAFDANGDLFISNAYGQSLAVLPASSGVLFGQAVTKDVAAPLAASTAAGTAGPFGLALDASGDLFYSNIVANTVIELASTPVLIPSPTLTAATGLDLPLGIVLDPNGDVFIANDDNSISVLPASSGTIFGQSVTAGQITTLTAASGLNSPLALAMDANGDLFISNDGNNTISVLPASTGTIFGQSVTANQITTLQASIGSEAPFGLSFDANGDLFGASLGTDQITVIPAHTGTIFGQSMTADVETNLHATAGINSPAAVDFDADGDLFASSNDTGAVTVVPSHTGTIFGQSMTADVASTLSAASGLTAPQGLAFDASGNLFVTNSEANTVTVLPASTGTIFGQSVTADVAATVEAATGLKEPVGIDFDAGGDLYIADESDNSLSMVPANAVPAPMVPTTTLSTSFAGLDGPIDMAFDAGGDLFVSNTTSNTITVDPASTGTLFGQSVSADMATTLSAATGLSGPYGIAMDAQGDLFIVNNSTNTVTVVPASTGTLFGQAVTADVATTLTAATGLDSPYGIVVDANGDLLITNISDSAITVVPASTGTIFGQSVTADVATTLSAASGLSQPFGMALDASGDLFVSNLGNNTISVLPASTGTLFGQSVMADQTATLAAASAVGDAYDIAVDASGDLFISNNAVNTVAVVPASTGTLFGQSVTANQEATLTAVTGLDQPEAPALDASGDLFVANFGADNTTVVPALTSSPSGPGLGSGPTGTPTTPTASTISLSLRANGALVRGKAVTLSATLSSPGTVTFTDNGHVIAGCANVAGTNSATCQWTPSLLGTNALVATLTPTSSSDSAATSLAENVSVISVPGAPTIKCVAAPHERVRVVEVRGPSTGGAPILGYQYAVNGVWHPTTLGHARSITISGLEVGHTYRVRLRARNRAGYGSPSSAVTVAIR